MGVAVSLGRRLGIDRNLDGVLDGDVPRPGLRITTSGMAAVISWPTNATGFVLERAISPPSTSWAPDPNVRGMGDAQFNVTNALSFSNLFFRLREL